MSRPIKVAIAGLGNRGRDNYGKIGMLYPDKMEIVAAADIDPKKVALAAEEFRLPGDTGHRKKKTDILRYYHKRKPTFFQYLLQICNIFQQGCHVNFSANRTFRQTKQPPGTI